MENSTVICRGRRHHAVGYFLLILISIGIYERTNNFNEFVTLMVISAVTVASGQLLWRICLLGEEIFHFKRVCGDSFKELFGRTFYFNGLSKCFVVIVALLGVVFNSASTNFLHTYDTLTLCLSVCASIIFSHVTRAEECPAWEAHAMKQLNGLDYGAGMAHSYFWGYLKVILPAKGNNQKNFQERIMSYMEQEGINEYLFPVQKLIVLVPRSGYCFPLLSQVPCNDGCDPDIQLQTPLLREVLDHVQDRAGAKSRVYRSSVYRFRVTSGNTFRFLYALAEGPTPLLTFIEACSSGSLESFHLRKHRVDIISNFCTTLQKLIDDDITCRNLVELIYYNDEDTDNQADIVSLMKEHLLKSCNHSKVFGNSNQ